MLSILAGNLECLVAVGKVVQKRGEVEFVHHKSREMQVILAMALDGLV